MKNALSLLAVSAAALSLAACMTAPRTLPPGEYSKTEKSVDKYGTATKKETTTNVYYDQHGNKRASQETETTRDPDGLFNKSKTKSTKTY